MCSFVCAHPDYLCMCGAQGVGGGNGGPTIGVCAMGAMWLTQLVFVSVSGQPKLAKGPEGYNMVPHNAVCVCYGLWVGCPINCNKVVTSCKLAMAPTANRQVLNGGGFYASMGPRQSMWAVARYMVK